MERIKIEPLYAHPRCLEICARWNVEAFGSATGRSIEETVTVLKRIAARESGEEVRLAFLGSEPVGFVLLIDCDLNSHAHLKPWLASLYVAPAARKKGVGSALVDSIEEVARQRGDPEIFLYTATPAYYRPLGWRFFEGLEKGGRSFEIMVKRLLPAPE